MLKAFRRLSSAAIAVTLLWSLAACESDDKPSDDRNSAAASTAKPGARYELGESPTIAYAIQAGEGTAEMIVTAFEAGRPGDLSAFPPDERFKGKTPWYLRYRLTT